MRELTGIIRTADDAEAMAKKMAEYAAEMRKLETEKGPAPSEPPNGDTRKTLNGIANMAVDVAAGFVNELPDFGAARQVGNSLAGELAAAINATMDERGIGRDTPMTWQDARAEAITSLRWVLGKLEAKQAIGDAEEEALIDAALMADAKASEAKAFDEFMKAAREGQEARDAAALCLETASRNATDGIDLGVSSAG